MADEKPSVYVETTVVSYLTARSTRDILMAAHQQATREWWDVAPRLFYLCTSQFVIDEASGGDAAAAAERLAVLSNISLLPIPAETESLADQLLRRGALPLKARLDAIHLAVAAISGVRYLCTWNCRHLANVQLRPKIELACLDAGFQAPLICTPLELNEA